MDSWPTLYWGCRWGTVIYSFNYLNRSGAGTFRGTSLLKDMSAVYRPYMISLQPGIRL